MIPKDIIDNIFETARIEEVVGDFVSLKKRGANMLGSAHFMMKKPLLSRFLLLKEFTNALAVEKEETLSTLLWNTSSFLIQKH